MNESKPDTSFLKKAAMSCYLMGIWTFVAAALLVVVVLIAVFPMIPMMGPSWSYDPAKINEIVNALMQVRDMIIFGFVVVAEITLMIGLIFGYYIYKVGKYYSQDSLKLAGISFIIMSIGFTPLAYGLYRLFGDLPQLIAIPSGELPMWLLISLAPLIAGAAIVGIFAVMFFIGFLVGCSHMRYKTDVNDFSTAMWLTIIGIFLLALWPIGIVIFGSGLNKLASQGAQKIGARPATAEEAPKETAGRVPSYCPYCGAKVEPSALFCPICGSSLKRER